MTVTFVDMIEPECECGWPLLPRNGRYWNGEIECGNCGEPLQQEVFTRMVCSD